MVSSSHRPRRPGHLRRLQILLCLALWTGIVAGARSEGPALLPLSQVKPGMTGYGLTVFRGTQPERFPVKVIGVLRQHLPQMDIILVESSDPRVMHSGIAAGMSGSPIYIDGKLMGALAYGWLFSKDAVGGVTPIEYMLREMHRPLKSVATNPTAAQATIVSDAKSDRFVAQLPDRRTLRAMLEDHGSATAEGDRALSKLLPPRVSTLFSGESKLVRAAVPLSVSGLGERAIEGLRDALGPYGLVPLQASGGGAANRRGTERFEPGGVLAVELIRGDFTAAGTGTVTHVEGNRVAAFGHQMLNAGEVELPIGTAEIVTILASQMSSFKMSARLEEKGALLLDHQSCIIGDTGQRAPTTKMQIAVRTDRPPVAGPPRHEEVFHVELASHRFLTAPLALSVVQSALQTAAPDIADAVIEVKSNLTLRGFEPLAQTDYFYSPGGVTEKLLMGATGMRQLQDLLANPFAPVRVERLDLRIDVNYRAEAAEISAIAVPGDELEADSRPNLLVTLRPYGGTPMVRAVPFDVPRHLIGQSVKIEAAAGHLVKPEIAPPDSLADLVDNLRKGTSSRQLVVTLSTPDEGVSLRGRLLPNLPASVIATLRPSGASKRSEVYKRVSRQVIDMGIVMSGKQELTVLVRDENR